MRDPIEILVQHPIKGEKSCIAWGVEFVAKLHDQIHPTSDVIQAAHPKGLGFGDDASDILKKHKVTAWEIELEWDEFEEVSKKDAAEGFHLIFTLPSLVNLDLINGTFGPMGYHACVAVHRPGLEYASRMHGYGSLFPVVPKKLYEFVRAQIQVPNYRIHCLRHRPEDIASRLKRKTA